MIDRVYVVPGLALVDVFDVLMLRLWQKSIANERRDFRNKDSVQRMQLNRTNSNRDGIHCFAADLVSVTLEDGRSRNPWPIKTEGC